MNTNDIISKLRNRISSNKLHKGVAKITVCNDNWTHTEFALEWWILYETTIDENGFRISTTSTR